ncbi:MAG TPA: prolipoprotein diacylglyceryl transferase family protein, partial [bacterium]|nr:prolipoprotein diacylglyceryl transferase family protein [bacterium]
LTARRGGLRFWDLADTVVWVVPLGNIFVRFGNFMNGELYGDPTTLPWGVTFPGVPAPRHPLQLYEMVFAAIILAVTLPRAARRRFPGEMFWLVLTLTSIGRILLDLLRSEDRVLGVLTLGMIPAALLAIAGGWILLTKGRASAGPGRPAARTP